MFTSPVHSILTNNRSCCTREVYHSTVDVRSVRNELTNSQLVCRCMGNVRLNVWVKPKASRRSNRSKAPWAGCNILRHVVNCLRFMKVHHEHDYWLVYFSTKRSSEIHNVKRWLKNTCCDFIESILMSSHCY